MNLDFILDERAREMNMELVRRTDLIRFGKFTKGYNWDWKGSSDGEVGTYVGKDVDDKYNPFRRMSLPRTVSDAESGLSEIRMKVDSLLSLFTNAIINILRITTCL